jgi:ribonuclease BN (tRNA processing enzyme)
MDLTFIGSGSAFNPDMENSNAFFTLGDRFYLIDCGETAFGRIWNLPELRSSRQVTVAVTHLHCDHVGSLGSLISYSFFVLRKKIRVYHPLDTVVRLLDLMGIDRANYTYLDRLEEGESEPVSFTPLQVEHVDNMTCFGYIVSAPSGRIYFSGDAKGIPDAVLAGFRKGEIDRIIRTRA